MSLTSAQLPDLSLSPQDEEIQRALAEVAEKLSAFAAAVAETQPALSAASASLQSEPVEVDNVGGATEGPAGAPAPVAEEAITAAETDVTPVPSAVVAEPEPAAQVEVVRETAPAPKVQPPATLPAPPQKARTEPSPAGEDEALLASLDPETAKAIRVMRRLSIERKSVRQLLEEFNAVNDAAGKDEPRKKSWWSRT